MIRVDKIASVINGRIEGDPNLIIKGVCDVKNSKPNNISYVLPGKYESYFNNTKASAVLIDNNIIIDRKDKTLIRVENPALSFIEVMHMFYPKKQISQGIHSQAIISKNVLIGNNVDIGPNAIIEEGVKIGNSSRIGAGSFIGNNSIIGNNSNIAPNVTLYHNSNIGSNCIIDSGTIIGADGFGLVTDKDTHHKMPHIGTVQIKDNVWIGANCCIDRGTFDDTIINEGTKLDNIIQVAHNVQIGKNCRISGQTAIAGSSILEDNITIGGQVGIIDHLTIGKDSIIAAKSAVFESIKSGSFVSGIPAKNHKNRLRQEVVINQLPEILNRLRKLEEEFSKSKGT